jgi:hypothetical protein
MSARNLTPIAVLHATPPPEWMQVGTTESEYGSGLEVRGRVLSLARYL